MLLRSYRTALLADEPGVGKSPQALTAIAGSYPSLIVCPATIKLTWQRHIEGPCPGAPLGWLPGASTAILEGRSPSSLPLADIYIINYEILSDWLSFLYSIKLKSIIYDECHYLMGGKSKRSKAGISLAKIVNKNKGKIYCLSGTPFINRPKELIPQLQALGRLKEFGGWKYFVETYCAGYRDNFGIWHIDGSSNEEELYQKLSSICMIRRLKKDVLPELPPKQRAIIDVPIKLSEYKKQAKSIKAYIKNSPWLDEKAKFVELGKLRLLVARNKLPFTIQWIRDFLESEEKLVVFAYHIEIQKALKSAFPQALTILGEDSLKQRQASVDAFQQGSQQLIICSLQAAKEGITLTAASNVLFAELGWNPATLEQAEGRLFRQGQQNAVTAWYLLAPHTVDYVIYRLIELKQERSDKILGDIKSDDILSNL
jgi:SNF2 family DNA or RNA helicase